MLSSGGCVSKSQFDNVSNDYVTAQEQLAKEKMKCDAIRDKNIQLMQEIETLKKIITKKEMVISLQKTAIRLVDDADQTLQTSIQEQIVSQDLGTKSVSFPTR